VLVLNEDVLHHIVIVVKKHLITAICQRVPYQVIGDVEFFVSLQKDFTEAVGVYFLPFGKKFFG